MSAEEAARWAAVETRSELCQKLADTPAGHLSFGAWCRIKVALEREISKERAALKGSDHEQR